MRSLPKHFVKGMRLDLWEFVLHIVGIHGPDLVSCGGSEHLDNLDKLVDAGLSWKERLTEHELGHHTAGRPNVYMDCQHCVENT